MNSAFTFALLVVFTSCLCKTEAFVIPRNETEGGPCRNFTIANILDITEELRVRMDRPLPRFNVPVLEPLFVEHISLDNFDLLAGLDIQLHNISFIGFSGFQINDLDFNLLGFGLSLQLVIPTLEISGQHASNGTLYGLVPVIGQGPVNLTVANLTFDIVGRLNHTNVLWEVPEIDVNFTITGISGGFENLTDNFFNELLNLSGPQILELAWPELQPTVEEAIADAVSAFLNGWTIEELMGFLFGAGLDWSDVDGSTTVPPISPTSVSPTSVSPTSVSP